VVGIIVADDIRKYEKKEPAPKKEELEKTDKTDWGSVAAAILSGLVGLAMLVGTIMIYATAFDPWLIAVMEDGRWVLLYEWYDK